MFVLGTPRRDTANQAVIPFEFEVPAKIPNSATLHLQRGVVADQTTDSPDWYLQDVAPVPEYRERSTSMQSSLAWTAAMLPICPSGLSRLPSTVVPSTQRQHLGQALVICRLSSSTAARYQR